MENHCSSNNQCENDARTAIQAGPASSRPAGLLWEITVRGHLTGDWSDWLDGLDVTCQARDQTVLCGMIVDQAALMGILNKLNRLNLTLLSLRQVGPKESY